MTDLHSRTFVDKVANKIWSQSWASILFPIMDIVKSPQIREQVDVFLQNEKNPYLALALLNVTHIVAKEDNIYITLFSLF